MKLKTTCILLMAFLVGCAAPSGSTALSEVDQKKEREENIVCEKVYHTSSRIPKKICTTLAEREKREKDEEASRQILKDAQDKGGTLAGDMSD